MIYQQRIELSNGYFIDTHVDEEPTIQLGRIGPTRDPDAIGPWGQLTSETVIGEPIALTQRDISNLTLGLLEMLKFSLHALKGLEPDEPPRKRLTIVQAEGAPEPEE